MSVSGGKDSTATALLAQERVRDDGALSFVFADTGNEEEQTYEYVRSYLPKILGPITWLRADFREQIAAKRTFIARDQRIGRVYDTIKVPTGEYDDEGDPIFRVKKIGGGRRIRWTNKGKRRALAILHPTGNPYLDLCLWKGRFPSRKAQFCTEELKTKLIVEHQLAFIDAGAKVWSWQGVRRDESDNRRNAKRYEHVGAGLYHYRPIVDWTAQQTVDFVLSRGVQLNPLYQQGMTRVGCLPCINASKGEISEIARRFPAEVERIEEWERLVALAAKLQAASFFPDPDRDAHLDKRGIRKVVQWARTSRGGRQFGLFLNAEPLACSSSYGLCE